MSRQFTANGHSIRFLRDRATALKNEGRLSHHEALQEVARAIGYPEWAGVMAEPVDPARDEFFSESFQLNDRSHPAYLEFLGRRALADSSDAYRQYVVEAYADFCDLGFQNYYLERQPGDPKELGEALHRSTARDGAAALLPQNISVELFERLLGHTRLAFVHMDIGRSCGLPPTGHLGPITYCVVRITDHLRTASNPRTTGFKIRMPTLQKSCETYAMRLELEFLSRRTRFKVGQPTLETVLQEDDLVLLSVAPLGTGDNARSK